MNTRPKTYTIAAIMQFLLSAFNGVVSIPFLMRGTASADAPPFFVELVIFATAILGILSAYGVSRNQKWGVILTIIICMITGLVNLPGLLFAPSIVGKLASSASLIPAIIIIVLLLWPKPKATPAASSNS